MPRATPCHSFKYWKVEMRKWPINTILGLQEQFQISSGFGGGDDGSNNDLNS